jgi:ectoine hydroxylase-related dioxygenase (phytanoyl-CoA dioxygenase family)
MNTNVLTNLPQLTKDLSQARRDVAETGVALVADALDPRDLKLARERTFEQLEAERERGCACIEGSGPNQRLESLLNKGEIFRRIVMNSPSHELARYLLGKEFLLSAMFANVINPGSAPQAIHIDQGYVGMMPQAMTVSFLWMLSDFTRENGGTLVIPGSHLWNTLPSFSAIRSIEPLAVEAPAGSVLMIDGRVWHGGGANRSTQPRPGLLSYFCRPYLRQKENFSLSLAPEVLETASPQLRALLGFQPWFTLGSVDGDDTLRLERRPTEFSRELRPQRSEGSIST